jgi:hypothetical protein
MSWFTRRKHVLGEFDTGQEGDNELLVQINQARNEMGGES